VLSDWLERGWDNPVGEVRVRESRNIIGDQGETLVERIDDDPQRVPALQAWRIRRDEWALNERPAREAMRIFEQLYEVHSRIEREAERVELVVGDGILNWRRLEGGIHHPVLLQRVQLEFDSGVPEFKVVETDHEVELYSALFRAMPDVDGKGIARCREELEKGGYHPLGETTSAFLGRLVVQLSPHGEFTGQGAPRGETDNPRISRDPILFLRARILGFATAIEAVLEDIQQREDISGSLLNVVGVETPVEEDDGPPLEPWSEPEEVLLSKETNPEQIQIAERLERHGSVIVQGPPGTGKTHTIANLIGHLLAQGKSVLVTAHTAKALRVLRDHVVEQLRPLCVSVLERDIESRAQLEASVEAIGHRLSKSDARQLESEADKLAAQRKGMLAKLRTLRQKLIDARADEYRDIVIAGRGHPPSDAARKVAEERERHDWIPPPITPGTPLPLSDGELIDLYRTNVTVTPEDEIELSTALPNPSDLLTPADFDRLVQERNRLAMSDLRFRAELWDHEPSVETVEALESLAERLRRAVDKIVENPAWKLAAIAAGRSGGPLREPWDTLLSMIDTVCSEAARAHEPLLRYAPALSRQIILEEQQRTVSEILHHLESGGSLGKLTLLIHPAWRRFISESRVTVGEPSLVEHFNALKVLISLRISRHELAGRWDRQLSSLGAPPSAEFGEQVERACAQFSAAIEECLSWYTNEWEPLETELKRLGFRWEAFLAEQPPNLSPYGELLRLRDSISGPLQEVLAARANGIRWHSLDSTLNALAKTLSLAGGGYGSAQVLDRLRRSVSSLEPGAFNEAFQRLVELHNRRTDLELRRKLLARLEPTAPGWASGVRDRRGRHAGHDIPGDAAAAWLWRQLYDELERRAQTSLEEIQQAIEKLTSEVRLVTVDLIDRLAWAAQRRRMTLSRQQALVGWLDTVRKIGKGTGKRVPRLRVEARQKMSECRSAVPVWIMPLSRVVENFNPRTTRFDVVIIDEASQSDVMALLTFYMASKVVVVGDHEQVSPSAVGQNLTTVQHLIDEHLQGIPNKILYDGQMSVYDLARQSFGGTICLLEHFRCVPGIIHFSNNLSYDWRIKPLRDPSLVPLKPHVIGYRVDGASADEKVNQKEVWAVASLLVAASEQPEYRSKKFGVVSLVGEHQALEIERLVRRHLPPEEYDRRRVLCGNAAQFQGDERHVMFLSLVDTRQNGPLRLREEARFKQRFNVAASRACDQMWVIHSLDPRSDLKPGDLRRKLIEHAEDPWAIYRTREEAKKRTQSKFEMEVMHRLKQAGYRVHPQWRAGYYWIDLVVEGGGRRLAVECDGDRYHPIEKLPEDMARQAVLERLGWKFVRIRGSQFFRDPETAMRPVFHRLSDLEITPDLRESETQTETETRDTELKDRVIRRAQELLREWMETDEEPGLDKRDSHAKPEEEPPGVEEGKKDQAANHGRGDAVQVSLEPYRRWTPRPLPDPRARAAAQFNVAQGLTEIIAAEGPMVCHRAYRIYVKAAGIQKVELEGIKFEVFQTLHGAIRLAKNLEWIEERNEFGTYDQINQIVRKAGTPAVVLRTLGNRTFQDIPPAEIGEMMKCLRTLEPNLEDEALLQSVLKHYEIEDMTPGMRARLSQIKAQYVDRSGD
jgi:very-short-patch-repair endonuclease/F0F1-type ATP synthase membrane subunit b/b'